MSISLIYCPKSVKNRIHDGQTYTDVLNYYHKMFDRSDIDRLSGTKKYIFNQEKYWFKFIKRFLTGRTLKIGSGLGYMTSFVRMNCQELTVLETQFNDKDPNKDIIEIHHGENIPFTANTFDCVVSTYVLHHTKNPILLMSEMKRVAKRLIILEETYSNLISKLDLVYRDIYVNSLAGQPSEINWNSYFEEGILKQIIQIADFNIVFHHVEKKRRYKKELYVLDKN